jgi:hydroxyatrazine ethylaminohydrolase
MEAAKLLGIRYHAGRGVNTLPASAGGSVPAVMVETTEEYLQDCQRLIDLYHDPKPYSMSQIVMSPCQPINCYPETFTETLKMARQNGVRMHTHLGEGENEIMEKRWGMRTLNWLEKLGFVGDDIWIAHGWELTKDEYAYLGQHGMGISHCIGPAVLGGFPILPLKQLQQQNVCVSLGCDGSSTNDSSSMLDSLRLAWTMQAFFSKTRGGCISPYEMLKIATVNGAKTLGRQDLGQLTPGYGADMFMIDTAKLSLCGTLHDPSNLLARVGVTEETAMTIINGKIVWQNGQFAGIDEQATITAANEVWKRVLYDKCEAYHFD